MPRLKRADEAGAVHLAFNLGIARTPIIHKHGGYQACERIPAEGLDKHVVSLLADQLMPNHWHLVLQLGQDGEMSAFDDHGPAHQAQPRSLPHIGGRTGYRGRYHSIPVQADEHFHTVCRDVKRNALRASVVGRAKHRRGGSLRRWIQAR